MRHDPVLGGVVDCDLGLWVSIGSPYLLGLRSPWIRLPRECDGKLAVDCSRRGSFESLFYASPTADSDFPRGVLGVCRVARVRNQPLECRNGCNERIRCINARRRLIQSVRSSSRRINKRWRTTRSVTERRSDVGWLYLRRRHCPTINRAQTAISQPLGSGVLSEVMLPKLFDNCKKSENNTEPSRSKSPSLQATDDLPKLSDNRRKSSN